VGILQRIAIKISLVSDVSSPHLSASEKRIVKPQRKMKTRVLKA
jgi:hypothetical protein